MNKLTYYDKWLGKYMPHKGTAISDIYTKLGRLEELEAAGRLVVLPAGFDTEAFQEKVRTEFCPNDFGIENLESCLNGTPDNKKCFICWKKAWEGKR